MTLIAHYQKLPISEISRLLPGRSVGSIYEQAAHLGLRRPYIKPVNMTKPEVLLKRIQVLSEEMEELFKWCKESRMTTEDPEFRLRADAWHEKKQLKEKMESELMIGNRKYTYKK